MPKKVLKQPEANSAFTAPFIEHFLKQIPKAEAGDPGIPIYTTIYDYAQGEALEDGDVFLYPHKVMATQFNKQFERDAPAGLYRGGAIIRVVSSYGTLVVPDERYGWWKPFAGIAQGDEGHDLTITGVRELIEEAFIYDVKKTTRFVPVGTTKGTSRACRLGFEVSNVVEVGTIKAVGFELNEKNKAIEAVLEWDITSIDTPYSVSLEEEWWAGGQNGVSVYVIGNDGTLNGVFSGQQGFIKIPSLGIHPTLQKYMDTDR